MSLIMLKKGKSHQVKINGLRAGLGNTGSSFLSIILSPAAKITFSDQCL